MRISKFLKNNLLEGSNDAFNIIYGNHDLLYKTSGVKNGSFRFGAADLFLFPLIAYVMMEWGFPMRLVRGSDNRYCIDDNRTNRLRTFIGYLGMILQLPRLGLAIALTVLILPILLVVHAIKYPFVRYREHQLHQLEGEIQYLVPNEAFNDLQVVRLDTFMDRTQSSLNDLYRGGEPIIIRSQKIGNGGPFDSQAQRQASISFFKISENNHSLIQQQALEAGRSLGIF